MFLKELETRNVFKITETAEEVIVLLKRQGLTSRRMKKESNQHLLHWSIIYLH